MLRLINHKMKKTIILLSAVAIFLYGCKNPDGEEDKVGTPTSVSQDKTSIKNGMDQMVSGVTDLVQGDFLKAVTDFGGVINGESSNDVWMEDMVQGLANSMSIGTVDGNGDYAAEGTSDDFRFSLNDYDGVYTYNFITEKFDVSSSDNGLVIVKFPTSPSMNLNDGELTISDYTYKDFDIEGDLIPLPKKFSMVLKKSGTKLFSVVLNDVEYETQGDMTIPRLIDLNIYASPYDMNITFNKSGTKLEMNHVITSEVGETMEMSGSLTLAHNTFSTISDKDLVLGQVEFTYGSLKAAGSMDIKSLIQIDDPSVAEFNQYADIGLYHNNSKIGDLVLVEDSEGEQSINIFYKDGTSEDMDAAYLQDFIDKVEIEFDTFL